MGTVVFSAYANEQRDLRWVSISLSAVALVLLTMRLTTTWQNRGWFGLEDAFVIASTHVADIKATGGDVREALKYFYLTVVFYILTNGMNKFAFLMLYHRVFPVAGFRKVLYVMMGISGLWTISYLIVGIFQCNPVARVYDRTIPGTCINFAWHRWTNAISNLVTDLIIFFLPLPLIMKLNMSLGNRIGLIILFSIGFFICLITTLRMATLPQTLKLKEPTWESAPTNLWSFIEAAVGVICACLISLRRTISRFWPQRWRSTKGASAGYYARYGGDSTTGGKMSRGTFGKGQAGSFHLDALKSGRKDVKSEAVISLVSRSESQERIFEGITVTKDVQVTRD
ncbi:uncharacterized protein CC84DRAFT_1227981 [Paraphaeosphaeria sporulosa]|uniref:Rhodopsin domain-containing protein n=1 Tax=Paraphaeosphaeria sporulosa TaxID=1460663 RepID=A0A177D0P4_9PLEO|nr:uncharacterized protein CC84DRAFT_1227981 [Paraphaeosphaeria sporulosa]OAG13086.1 hypothetical protein CC84DRAFT_1227981 [Paraphaeosphaeria sporulosa]